MQHQKGHEEKTEVSNSIEAEIEAEHEIHFTWIERDEDDMARRGTMYCFKSCSVNAN
jgi:hypothetical protein